MDTGGNEAKAGDHLPGMWRKPELEQGLTQSIVWLTVKLLDVTSEGGRRACTRVGLHGAMVLLTIAVIALSSLNIPATVPLPLAASAESDVAFGIAIPASPARAAAALRPALFTGDAPLSRQANPITQIPDRPRAAIVTYTVQPGDTLFGIALQYNLAPETLLWANADLKDNPDLLDPGMTLHIPPVDGIMHEVQEGDTLQSIAEKYKVGVEAIIDAEWNSLRQGQQPIVGQYVIVPGGKREVVVWQLPVRASASVAASFASLHTGFCEGVEPAALGSGTFIWPTDSHYVGGNPYASWHRAIDMPQNSGNAVYASDSGTVVYAGWNSWGYGNLVVLDHGNGWQTWYAHLSQIYVGCGQQLYQGAVIGAVGSTGRSTGPHLHFETRYEGSLPNPLNVLP